MTTKTKKTKKLLVPVRLHGRGGMLHDTDYARGAESVVDAAYIDAECLAKSGHMRWGADYYMAEVEPFTARLRVVSADSKGSYVNLVDEHGHHWPMFTSDYVAMMTTANVSDGLIEPATYEACKKGVRAYGIRAVKES